MTFAWRNWALGMLTVSAVAVSCTQDFNAFQFNEPSGAGASGPASSSSTSSAGGSMGECSGDMPCPATATKCKLVECKDEKCVVTNASASSPCDDNGGAVCDGLGACVECIENDACPAEKPICSDKKCIPKACMNGVKDGVETDIDCGGKDCPKCDKDKDCGEAGDCLTNFCKPADSGAGGAGGGGGGGGGMNAGGVCQPCGPKSDCAAGEYCDSKQTCVPELVKGDECAADGDCATGFCTDGRCCDKKCDGVCEACSNGKTGEPNGTCALIKAGKDPDMECVDTPAMACGPEKDKGCSGTKNACDLWPASTECRMASCDTNTNTQTAPAKCDGMGACPAAQTSSCGQYVCNEGKTACFSDCTGSKEDNCKNDAYCKADKCTACGQNGPPEMAVEPAICDAGVSTKKLCHKNCTSNACVAFTCPAGYDCTVNCANNSICKDAKITCPDDFHCIVNCGATGACEGAKIKSGKGGTLKVTCGDFANSCKNAEVGCGVNECEVGCAGTSKPMIMNCEATPGPTNACKCSKNTCM